MERVWIRPPLEINGIVSGYYEEGGKRFFRPPSMSQHSVCGVTSSELEGPSQWWKHSPGCCRCR
ncbi:hypothetical protein [Polycladomyces subterraneus]|uniref:Uncharacterized protein n=1 Tax=Polycladomyces subterraneus TaxID=1016997 RepID=A0ABT8ISH5_9BACL|nr:hypothetical protein [Polycladomyces subterraneus]MDN4595411.1 hypothetical protein [Polycladomyces subterraneus]